MKKKLTNIDNMFYSKSLNHNDNNRYILYVHGGPGNNSSFMENFYETNLIFKKLNLGLIVYDQRGCGKNKIEDNVTHDQNISDLNSIFKYWNTSQNHNISAIYGHSYGGTLVNDFIEKNKLNIPIIISGRSPLREVPSIRNRLIDQLILKINQPDDYIKSNDLISDLDVKSTEARKLLRSLLNDPKIRNRFYWYDLKNMENYEKILFELDSKENQEIFYSVMESIRAKGNLKNLEPIGKYLWIQGKYDFIMGGDIPNISKLDIKLYENSGHYPFFEQTEKFVNDINYFLANDL